MKETLGVLGLGALLCLPCLALAAGVGGVAFAGGLIAFAGQALVQIAGALLLIGVIAFGMRYEHRRREPVPTDAGARR